MWLQVAQSSVLIAAENTGGLGGLAISGAVRAVCLPRKVGERNALLFLNLGYYTSVHNGNSVSYFYSL